MTTLEDIAAQIKSNLDGNKPPFQGTPIALAAYQDAAGQVLSADTFTLSGATITAEDDRIILRGQANLLGLVNADLALGFRLHRGRCFFFVQLPVASPDLLQALTTFSSPIGQIRFNWQFGPVALDSGARKPVPISTYGFNGVFQLGAGFELPFIVGPAAEADVWNLTGDFDAIPLSNPGALLKWFAGSRRMPTLPAGFDTLTGLSVCGLGVHFNSKQARIDSASLTVATDKAWPLIKDRLVLERISLSLGYSGAGTDAAVSAGIYSVFNLAGKMLPVSIQLAGGHVQMTMEADDLSLPGLQALAGLAGLRELFESVPEPIAAISDLVLRGLVIDIDAAHANLTRLDASLGSVQPIGLMQGVTLQGTDIDLSIEPGTQQPLTVTLRALMAAGDEYFALFGQLKDTLQFSGTLDELPLTAIARKFVPDLPAALGDLQLYDAYLQVTSAGQVDFSAGVSWDIHAALQALGLPPLPDGTAGIELSSLTFSADLTAKTWRIELTPQNTFEFPVSGAHRITMSAISVSVANDGFACQFTLDGEAAITDTFSLSARKILCSCQSATKDWHFGGDLVVTLMGRTYPFAPQIDIDAKSASFVLTYAKNLPLSPWPAYASVIANDIEISLNKDDAQPGYRWGVQGKAHFDIAGGFIVADGGLQLSDGTIQLTADVSNSPSIELAAIPGKPRIDIGLQPLTLTIGSKDSQALKAGGTVTVKGMPAPASVVFPDGTSSATLQIDKKGFAIAFAPLTDPTIAISFLGITLPEIAIEKLLLRQTTSASGGKQWQLGAELKVSRLAQFNQLFGNADLIEDSADLLMTVGQGLSLALNGPSPLKPVKLRLPKDDGTVWTEWLDVRDTGRFSFRVPEFAFDFAGGRWHASGGVESQGELTLPLGLIKRVLEPLGLDKLLQAMPDKVPLAELDLTSKNLYQQFEQMLGKLPDAAAVVFKRLTELLQQGLERLPANMIEYLRINIPRELTFEMSVEPSGGYAFGLRTRGDPLRLLLPWVSPAGPGLLGATIHYLSLGLSGGGSVAVVKCDAYFDQFDAVGLTYALITGKGEALSNRFEMRETTALVPVAAPFPLPLFYRRFGWSYHDFLGIRLEAHAAFGPLEEPPLTDWLYLIRKLVDFFSKSGWYLHEHEIPASMQLPFTLDPTFLGLPSYLGGGRLGTGEPLPTLPVAKTLATALDGIKAGNIGWIIQSIPLRHPDQPGGTWIRVGSKEIPFGPLEIDAAWCISTRDEFQNIILKNPDAVAMLDKANAGEMLTCLPQKYGGASYDKGYVILLAGGLKVGSPLGELFHFACQFGMAAMGPREFETAVRIAGGFGPQGMLELGIEGRLKTDVPPDHPDSTRVHVDGNVYLSVAQHRFELGGNLDVVSGVSFSAGIHLELTKHLLLEGDLTVTAGQVRIAGSATFQNIKLGTSATFDQRGVIFEAVKIDVGALTAKAALQFPGRQGNAFSFWAGVDLPASFTEDFKKSLIAAADAEVTPAINEAYTQFESYAKQVDTFEQSLTGLQGWLPGFCNTLIRTINARTTDKAIKNAMWKWAGKNIGKKIAVRAAITAGSPGKTARKSAAPWIAKLKAVRVASAKPVDQQYKAGLQKALQNLIATNKITVNVGVGKVKFRAYENKAVLTRDQIAQIREGIEYVGKLPEASKQQTHFQQLLDRVPREQLLAQVRDGIDKGMQAIPTVNSIGFEASAGFNASAVNLTAAVSYNARDLDVSVPVDLTRPDQLPAAISKAFADAYAKS